MRETLKEAALTLSNDLDSLLPDMWGWVGVGTSEIFVYLTDAVSSAAAESNVPSKFRGHPVSVRHVGRLTT